MAKQRISNPVIPDYRPKSERTKGSEHSLSFSPCLTCRKKIEEGYYGRWQEGGTCSKTCELKQEELARQPISGGTGSPASTN